ncbi:MAG: hypothetical protein LCH99_25750 [Proteobacteria bacterium]|nr:hypothetical protein [Pseudomonadota bacterium]
MIDVAIAIDGEAVSVMRTTHAAGSYDADGKGVPGASTTSTIRAVIQPASGHQLNDVPEGMRTSSDPKGVQTNTGWLLWSRSEIKVDDQITSKGIVYRVMYLWPRDEGAFYRAALGRVTK